MQLPELPQSGLPLSARCSRGQQCQGQSELVMARTALPRGTGPQSGPVGMGGRGWAPGLGPEGGLLSGIQMTFLLGEREREIKALTVCPGTSLRAGPLGRWEWIKSEVTAKDLHGMGVECVV